MTIEDVRHRIDHIDRRIAELVGERTALTREAASSKRDAGLPIYDGGREAAVVGSSPCPAVAEEVVRLARADAARAPEVHPPGKVLGGGFSVVAGPCSAEHPEQIEEVAVVLARLGVRHMRAGAWKPRTRRAGFQGHGAEALTWMRESCDRHGLQLWTEVRDVANVEQARGLVDVAWIGARNAQNFELLRLMGETFPRVALKRGPGMSVDEWLGAAEYVTHGGASVALVERGVRSFDRTFRNMLDLAGAWWVRRLSGLEVIVDVSHSTGLPALAAPMARAALAAGLDGVMVEAHPRPRESVTDADQALSLTELEALVRGLG